MFRELPLGEKKLRPVLLTQNTRKYILLMEELTQLLQGEKNDDKPPMTVRTCVGSHLFDADKHTINL